MSEVFNDSVYHGFTLETEFMNFPSPVEAPAAFAGIIYLVVRQKYFVGYLGQTSQRYITTTHIIACSFKTVSNSCFVLLQHSWLPFWKACALLLVPDEHCGYF